MATYMTEDICKGCEYAVFHDCCGKFCQCKEKLEGYRNYEKGTCKFKKISDKK
jgi:hypothetical protein